MGELIRIGHGKSDLNFLSRNHKDAKEIIEFANDAIAKLKDDLENSWYCEFFGYEIQIHNELYYVAIRKENEFRWGKWTAKASPNGIKTVHRGWSKNYFYQWARVEAQRIKAVEAELYCGFFSF